jgi:hypothetical protein
MFGPDNLPRYRDLPIAPDKPAHSAWGLFGNEDNVGLFNLITPERTAAAAHEIRRGAVFPLNWELEQPSPPMFNRSPVRHTILPSGRFSRDDLYDNFFP